MCCTRCHKGFCQGLLSGAAADAFAQNVTASFGGYVWDAIGQVVPKASVRRRAYYITPKPWRRSYTSSAGRAAHRQPKPDRNRELKEIYLGSQGELQ